MPPQNLKQFVTYVNNFAMVEMRGPRQTGRTR
jgi:hypothetical protein